MTVDVRAIVIRFADLWAVDPHQMVDEIYAVDIEMENMANPARIVLGGDQLHVVEDRLADLIPEHRHELVRVIVAGDVACLETTVVAPLTHEYAPACVWWWLDDTGKVGAETGWFDWDDRTTESQRADGTVPPLTAAAAEVASSSRDQPWYAALARDYADRWTRDPAGSAIAMFAPECTFGRVGHDEHQGTDALRRVREDALGVLPVPGRWMDVQRVAGEGSAIAMLVTIGNSTHQTRGTVVLTLGAEDLIVSERVYLDWSKATSRSDRADRMHVGSPEWTVRADGRW